MHREIISARNITDEDVGRGIIRDRMQWKNVACGVRVNGDVCNT